MKNICGLLLAGLIAVPGCAEKKPPKKQGDWMDNLKVQNPDAEPDLSGADPEPTTASSAEAAEPKPDTKIKLKGGRPLIRYGPKSKIASTFGATPGSKLELTGGMTLVIPEFSLDGGYNMVWKIAGSRAPTHGAVVGIIASLKVSPGDKPSARKISSRKDSFQIRMGTLGAETINLAIGEVASDKQGNEKGAPTWTVIAPKKVDKAVGIVEGEEKTSYTAVFELESIGPILYVHGTTADPS